MTIATGDTVVVEYTGRMDDGTVFDTSLQAVADESGLATQSPQREYSPLRFEVGAGQVLQGLEDAVVGLEHGSTPTVAIPPEKAHGEWQADRLLEYEIEQFRESIGGKTPEEGAYLETKEGDHAEIVHVDDDVVRVDFNAPLAGETLEFDLEVVEVNSAT
jgi:FKBP-type peptidyl-prolyl cis-trans isomerase 2